MTLGYVYSIRAKSRAASGKVVPRRAATVTVSEHEVGNGLVAEVERIVEAKVNEMLKARLGTLFGV